MTKPPTFKITPRGIFGLIILLGLIHGLIYVFSVPPWQHYDEPNHFEYIWLIANRGRLPEQDEYDPAMRRVVAESMLEHNFYGDRNSPADSTAEDRPVSIGNYSQLEEPPLYYLLAALPVALMKSADVTAQLYAARITSLLLYLVSIAAAYGMVVELTSAGNPLRWAVPLTMALLPGLADLMTSANNDVAAVAFLTLLLWGCVRMLRRGVTLSVVLWVIAATGLCLLSKESAAIALPIALLSLFLALFREKRWRWFAWGGLGLVVFIGFLLSFSWGDAAFWHRDTLQPFPTRAIRPEAPLGSHALQIGNQAEKKPRLQQMLILEDIEELRGKRVTLGAWMWADQPGEAHSPILNALSPEKGFLNAYQNITISSSPAFYAFNAAIPQDTSLAWISLEPLTASEDPATVVYYDGVTLVEGQFPADVIPQWEDAGAHSGIWAGQSVVNLARNASAELAWPRVNIILDRLGVEFLPDEGQPSSILHSLLDLEGTGWYYWLSLQNLGRTFWGKFGWGNVPLLGHKPYRPLGVLTVLGLVGFLFVGWQRTRSWQAGLILAITVVVLWVLAFTRGAIYLFFRPFIPAARYALPAVAPTLAVLCLGWFFLLRKAGGLLRIPEKVQNLIYGLFLVGLAVYALISIQAFFG